MDASSGREKAECRTKVAHGPWETLHFLAVCPCWPWPFPGRVPPKQASRARGLVRFRSKKKLEKGSGRDGAREVAKQN